MTRQRFVPMPVAQPKVEPLISAAAVRWSEAFAHASQQYLHWSSQGIELPAMYVAANITSAPLSNPVEFLLHSLAAKWLRLPPL